MLWAFHGPLRRKLLSPQTLVRPWKPNLFKCLVIVKIHGMIIFLFKIFGLKCKFILLKVCFSLSTARNMCCTGCQSSSKHHMVKEQQASGGWWERCVYLCMLQKEKISLEWLGQVWHLYIAGRQMFFFFDRESCSELFFSDELSTVWVQRFGHYTIVFLLEFSDTVVCFLSRDFHPILSTGRPWYWPLDHFLHTRVLCREGRHRRPVHLQH